MKDVVKQLKLMVAVIMAFSLLAIGSVAYHIIEGWSYTDSLYFTTVTLATIGYGDLAPRTDAGKIFTVFFILAGVSTFLLAVSTIAEFSMRKRTEELAGRVTGIVNALEKIDLRKNNVAKSLGEHTLKQIRRFKSQ